MRLGSDHPILMSTQLTDEEILTRSKKAYSQGAINQLEPVVKNEERTLKIAKRIVKQASHRNKSLTKLRNGILESFQPAE